MYICIYVYICIYEYMYICIYAYSWTLTCPSLLSAAEISHIELLGWFWNQCYVIDFYK